MALGGGPSSSKERPEVLPSIPIAREGEMYCLKWHTFQSYFTKKLKALFTDGDASDDMDVTLGAEGQYVRAHRWLLSICSPYFEQLFKVLDYCY